MKVEDIIEGLNKHIEARRKVDNISAKGHLVLQKVITLNPTFKAYKSYEAILWFISYNKKYRVITIKHTAKAVNGLEEEMKRRLNIELSLYLFNWIGSMSYNQVLMGTYKEGEDETTEV